MTLCIRSIAIEPLRLTPAEAELVIRVVLTGSATGMQARGKLVGPKCPGSTTVEVAYTLTPIIGSASDETLLLRCVIPEPNLWSETTPFRYEGRIDIGRDAETLDSRAFVVELRPQVNAER